MPVGSRCSVGSAEAAQGARAVNFILLSNIYTGGKKNRRSPGARNLTLCVSGLQTNAHQTKERRAWAPCVSYFFSLPKSVPHQTEGGSK